MKREAKKKFINSLKSKLIPYQNQNCHYYNPFLTCPLTNSQSTELYMKIPKRVSFKRNCGAALELISLILSTELMMQIGHHIEFLK